MFSASLTGEHSGEAEIRFGSEFDSEGSAILFMEPNCFCYSLQLVFLPPFKCCVGC